MPTNRSYRDACPIGRALDVVGERWALLVVRELFFGPLRFSDIRRALPGASSNLVADRLRELEGHGVVRRRQLPPPAGSRVYELTDWGQELEPILLALGSWGSRVPFPPGSTTLSATSVLLFLRGAARPDLKAPPTTYRLDIDDRAWSVRTEAGKVDVLPGEPAEPHASLTTDPKTLNDLLADPTALDNALTQGKACAEGNLSALRRLLQAVATPSPTVEPPLV